MHLGPLCMQLRAPISFFLLFGANSSPEKVQHFLISPNSIKIVSNEMFFGAATGSGVLLCWGRCTKTGADSPEGFALLLGQCAALRSLAQSTTPFLASGEFKNGVFSLRIAHIAPSLCFCTKGIFFGWFQRD